MKDFPRIELDELTNKEINVLVREFCRRRLVEGYHKDEVVILAKREFDDVISGENPKVNPATFASWVAQIHRDIIYAERDNRKNFARNLSIAQQRLELIYTLCIQHGDIKNALRAHKDLCELQGLTDGKIILNLGFQQNNYGSGDGQQPPHNSGSIPEYTPFSAMTTEELKQKVIGNSKPEGLDVLETIKKTQEVVGETIYIDKGEANQLIAAHNSKFSDAKK